MISFYPRRFYARRGCPGSSHHHHSPHWGQRSSPRFHGAYKRCGRGKGGCRKGAPDVPKSEDDEARVAPFCWDFVEANPAFPPEQGLNVIETDKEFVICLDVPGSKLEDVKVEEKNGDIEITAQRKVGTEVVSESSQSMTFNTFTTDMALVSAELLDGVLTVKVPKKAVVPPEPLVISVADPDDMEQDGVLRASTDVPGVKLADLKVEYQAGRFHVQGQRPPKRDATPEVFLRELSFEGDAAFDPTSSQAFLMDGVLTVTAARLKESQPRTIPIVAPVAASAAPAADDEEKKPEAKEDVAMESAVVVSVEEAGGDMEWQDVGTAAEAKK